MKKTSIFGALLVVVFAMTSCLNDWLTVQPLTVITNENYWKTESDARAELNSAYAYLQSAYKLGYIYWTEGRSDDFLGNSSGTTPTQNTTLNRLSSDRTQANWNLWYNVVSIANYAIYYIPKMQNVNVTNQNHMLSEAYFLRAFAYFNLYRIWGDVPLMIEPTLKRSEVTKPFAADKSKVFAQVVSDLDKAIPLVNTGVNELYIYSPAALYALVTEVAMWEKDYNKAVTYSGKLFDLGYHTIVGVPFADVCAKADTKDNIWTLNWDFANNGENTITTTMLFNTSNPWVPTKEIFDKWFEWEREWGDQVYDIRRVCTIDSSKYSLYVEGHAATVPAGAHCWKWSPGVHGTQTTYQECKMPIFRLADIILLRAEALCQLDRKQEAIAEMNKIRTRAGLPLKDATYYTDPAHNLLEDIWQERQFELYAEGKRWFDLMRTDRVEKVMNAYFTGYIAQYGGTGYVLFTEAWQKYWPIYKNNLNENENLKQIGNY